MQDNNESGTANKAEDHKNEGFLKSAWHRITHQHDNLKPETPETPEKKKKEKTTGQPENDEPKKATGSG